MERREEVKTPTGETDMPDKTWIVVQRPQTPDEIIHEFDGQESAQQRQVELVRLRALYNFRVFLVNDTYFALNPGALKVWRANNRPAPT